SQPANLLPLTTPPARGSASTHRLAPLCSYHLCLPSAVRPGYSSLPLSCVFLPHRYRLHCTHAWHPKSGRDCLPALLAVDMARFNARLPVAYTRSPAGVRHAARPRPHVRLATLH
ncbi:unnamed protein product, partial [Closterium sp. Naga37s-1]